MALSLSIDCCSPSLQSRELIATPTPPKLCVFDSGTIGDSALDSMYAPGGISSATGPEKGNVIWEMIKSFTCQIPQITSTAS